jgi:hypothetical protein
MNLSQSSLSFPEHLRALANRPACTWRDGHVDNAGRAPVIGARMNAKPVQTRRVQTNAPINRLYQLRKVLLHVRASERGLRLPLMASCGRV